MESKAAQQYFSRVRRRLACPAASRDQLLGRGRKLVAQFEQENPNAQYSDFVAAFGPPGDFAGKMLSCVDSEKVEAVQRRRKLGRQIVLIGLALLLCAVAALGWVKWGKAQEVIQGDFWVVKGTPRVITQEEYEAIHAAVQGQANMLIP